MLYRDFFKPLLDFCVAFSAFILALPIFILATIGLYFANQGKPFFFQPRPGKGGKVFRVIKFKTMNDLTDENGELLPDAKRLTPVGTFVRKTSLDELPQLLNVIKGDMSLIGPRPLLVKYQPYYTPEEMQRFNVRPGITGLAQISGRNMLHWDKRLALDVEYVKNISFILDLRIIYRTVINVFTSKDIVVDSSSIMLDLDVERKLSNQQA